MTLQAGKVYFNNATPFKLISLADTVGEVEFWWGETAFVDHPETKMLQFNKNLQYKEPHARVAWARR